MTRITLVQTKQESLDRGFQHWMGPLLKASACSIHVTLAAVLFLCACGFLGCSPSDTTKPLSDYSWCLVWGYPEDAYDPSAKGKWGEDGWVTFFKNSPFNYDPYTIRAANSQCSNLPLRSNLLGNLDPQSAADFLKDWQEKYNNFLVLNNNDPFIWDGANKNPEDRWSFLCGVPGPIGAPSGLFGATVPRGALPMPPGYGRYAISFIFTARIDVDHTPADSYDDRKKIAVTVIVLHELGHNRGLNTDHFDSPCTCTARDADGNCTDYEICAMRKFPTNSLLYAGWLTFCRRHTCILKNCLKDHIKDMYDAQCVTENNCNQD